MSARYGLIQLKPDVQDGLRFSVAGSGERELFVDRGVGGERRDRKGEADEKVLRAEG